MTRPAPDPPGRDSSSDGVMPSSVSPDRSWFDRFAEAVSGFVSRAVFFAFAVALVVVWAPSYWIFSNVDTYQLVINTATTIGTWILVALLQNSQRRADQATQHKLNAIAEGLADLMASTASAPWGSSPATARQLRASVDELRQAVGLEERESS